MTGPVIDRAEWNFNAVTEKELQFCFYYEYARENKEILARTHTYRDDPTQSNLHRLLEAAGADNMAVGSVLSQTPGFPDVPWQALPETYRQHWSKSHLVKIIETRPAFTILDWERVKREVRDLGSHRFDGEIFSCLIDWRAGVNRVIADFEKWARQNHVSGKRRQAQVDGVFKRKRSVVKEKNPRKSYREWLKQLGVVRLHRTLKSWPKVLQYAEANKAGLYGTLDDRAWKRARKEAVKRIQSLFPVVLGV